MTLAGPILELLTIMTFAQVQLGRWTAEVASSIRLANILDSET